jgi:membrane protein DedA with SNARE-associated domain
MDAIKQYVVDYGLPLIFIVVFLAQLGVPIPALPVLVVAGALAVDRDLSITQILAISVLASVIADFAWYWLGRRQGYRILRTLCKISLSPDSCVRQTESLFKRMGMPALLVAKFIPGFSTVAPPLAGATGGGIVTFLIYDAVGALLWAGAGVLGGVIFHTAIDSVLNTLASIGGWGLVIVGAALAIAVAYKWWQRYAFYKFLRMARITVDDLSRLMQEGKNPIVLDVRSATGRASNPRRIKGAAVLDVDNLDAALPTIPRDREVIVYCT